MSAKAAFLEDRGIVSVAGAEAGPFLHNLVTNDVLGLAPGEARFAALLTPQGKIVADFFILRADDEHGPRYLLDCPAPLTPELMKKLALYRLRAKLDIADRSAELGVAAYWDGAPPERAWRDPRETAIGWRKIAPRDGLRTLGDAGYAAHRIACGVPQGGADFVYGDAFPHDVNMDALHGVDFKKGCYVGQEVVSRVQHRGAARKRVLRAHFSGAPPAVGAEIMAGDAAIGVMGSTAQGLGLALVRVDKLEEAMAAGAAIRCGATPLHFEAPGV